MLWIIILVAVLVLIFYLRREHLDSTKESKDTKDSGKGSGEASTDSKDTKDSGKESGKDTKDTTIIIVDSGRDDTRRADPFYTMTDPYWASYNYRWGHGPRHMGPPIGHRRIW